MKFGIFVGLFLICSNAFAWHPPDILIGTWFNKAEVFAAFKKDQYPSKNPADSIEIEITINPDGTVTGTVGNATLENCKIGKNRSWLGRFLKIRTDYIIHKGHLSGKIVQDDKETRRNFTIPFNIVDDQLVGGFMVKKAWKYPEPMFPRLRLKRQDAAQRIIEGTS